MEFLAAPLLWGLIAAGIPVVIHLLGRTRPVPYRFPAMRFLARSQKATSRVLRVKHLLVLLLRMAVLCLMALALARPLSSAGTVFAGWIAAAVLLGACAVWALFRREYTTGALCLLILAMLYAAYPGAERNVRRQLHGDFVLILDQSMSMSYVEPEGVRFDLARQEALQLLDRLAPDARVALVLATETAERAQGRLTFQHEAVRRQLWEAQPSGRGLDFAPALLAAQEILARGGTANAAVVLFTDLQANAMNALLARNARVAQPSGLRPQSRGLRHERGARRIPLFVLDVGAERAGNGAALSVGLPGGVLPANTTLSLPARVRPVDRTHACLVELYVDGRCVAQKRVEPRGQEVVDVELELGTGQVGQHAGRLHLAEADRLPMDQDFMFVFESGRPASALVLEAPARSPSRAGEGAGGGGKGTAFFIQAALQPVEGSDPVGMSGLTCVVEPAGELTAASLARHRVVILADCGPLSPNSWSALQHWTNDGGGLFVWLGPNADLAEVRRYGFQEYATNCGLLPGSIGAVVEPARPEAVSLVQGEQPLLPHFTSGVLSLLRQAKVRRFVKIAAEPRDPNCSAILELDGGSPLLLEKAYGRGRVLLCAVGPDLAYSDLPRHGEAFVTLVLDGVRLLAGGDGDLRGRLGFPLVLTLPIAPADGKVLWSKPGVAAPVVLLVDAAAPVVGGTLSPAAPATVVVPPLDVPGIHEFAWRPASSKVPLVKRVAVNPDTNESNLAKAAPKTALQAFAAWDAAVVKDISESALLGGTRGAAPWREFAMGLLLVVLGLLLAESFLSNRLYGNASGMPDTPVGHGETDGHAEQRGSEPRASASGPAHEGGHGPA